MTEPEVERTPYCPRLADVATDSYPSCDGPYCAWFSPKLEMCSIRVAGESLAGIGVKFLEELKRLNTTLENKLDNLNRIGR